MATENFAGPVDYVVFVFPRGADLTDGLSALLERVNAGAIEILDLEAIGRDGSGAPTRILLADVSTIAADMLAVLDGIESSVLDDADLTEIANELEPEQFAIAVVYEDRSLAAAANAWSTVGGVELYFGGVDISDLDQIVTEGNQS